MPDYGFNCNPLEPEEEQALFDEDERWEHRATWLKRWQGNPSNQKVLEQLEEDRDQMCDEMIPAGADMIEE